MSRATMVDSSPEEDNAEDLINEAEEVQLEVEQPQEEQPTIPEK
jgi:hypothetical protein